MVKPTVHDIASEAGVSLATVDRVLNSRSGVRAKTVERVQAAVEKLGYVRDTYAANLARQKQYRFAFLLPDSASQFVGTLKAALLEASDTHLMERINVKVVPVPAQDPHGVVRALHGLNTTKLDGLAIMAPETPQVRDALARIKREGIAIVALLSDLPNAARDHFVGINSYAAGRTAAFLMGRFVHKNRGKVLTITNSMLARDSIDRRLGFDAVLLQEFPHLMTLPSVEFRDDADRMAMIIKEVCATHPDLVGIYSMGSGNQAMIEGFRALARLDDLVVIAHELTPFTRKALLGKEIDAVIAQNVGHLARSALRILRAKCDGVAIFEAQERIRIDVVTRENIP